jgi:hypothetical protein
MLVEDVLATTSELRISGANGMQQLLYTTLNVIASTTSNQFEVFFYYVFV